MQNPAVTDDLRARWYPNPLDDPAAVAVAQTRLNEAWRALQDELPGLVGRIESGVQSIDTVVDVVCSAALRILRNPEGYTDGATSIDDYSESWKTDPATRSSDLYFTAAELRRLTPAARGAFTITPGV